MPLLLFVTPPLQAQVISRFEQESSCTILSIWHAHCCLCLFSTDRSCRKVGLKCRPSSNRECSAEWRPRYPQISQKPLSVKLIYGRDTTVNTRGALHCVATYVMFPNILAPELFFLILAHPVYKMWIIQEPNKLELWNKLYFKEKKTESINHV